MRRLGLLLAILVAAPWTGGLLAPRSAWAAEGLERAPLPAWASACPRPPSRADVYRQWGLDDDPRVRIALPVWIPGITGTLASGDSRVEGDDPVDGVLGDLSSVLTDIRFAFVGSVAVQHGRWGLTIDGFGAVLDGTYLVGPKQRSIADGTLKAFILRADVSYLLTDRPVALGGRLTRLRTRAYVGGRYYRVHLDVERVLGFETGLDAKDDWVDPLLGVRADWTLSRRLSLFAETDVGGFGLGSDFAWWISGGLEYRISRRFSIGLGYTNLRFQRDVTDEDRPLDWNLRLSGPTLALAFRF